MPTVKEIGEALMPVLADLLDQLQPLIEATITWVKENKAEIVAKMREQVQKLIEKLPALLDLIKGLGVFFAKTWETAQLLWNGLKSAIARTMKFLVDMLAALPDFALPDKIFGSPEDIKRFADALGEELKETDKATVASFEKLFELDESTTRSRLANAARVTSATKQTAAELRDQERTLEAIEGRMDRLPAGIGEGGKVEVKQFNFNGTFNGTDAVERIIASQRDGEDTGRGGGDETPPAF